MIDFAIFICGMAILIAAMGLYSLIISSHMENFIEKKIKETLEEIGGKKKK